VTTVAEDLAAWVSGLGFADLPASVMADAKLRVLDTIGISLAACWLPIGEAVRRGAAAIGAGDDASILGTGERTSAALAGLVNGTLAHALDFDDTHTASVMHPSATSVPTALAVAQMAGCSGADLLLAVAIGNEVGCRLGLVAPGAFHQVGLHPTGALGVPAAALAAGRLLRLPARALVAAQGISGSQASGILEAYSDGTWSKTLHPGWAAYAGIVAARLAEAGFTGPASVFEGRFGIFRSHVQTPEYPFAFALATDALGRRWEMLETAFKLYPCAHAIHPFIEATLELKEKHQLSAEQIERIILDVPAAFIGLIAEPRAAKLAPRTPTHARASVFYAVAAALADGELGMHHYTEASIVRADILALCRRMTHRITPMEAGPIRFSGTVELECSDGRRLTATVRDAYGTGDRPLDATAVEAKFVRTAAGVLPAAQLEHLVALCRRLETMERVDELLQAAARP
jgi:2-methylcitrate dehydratase PrpD